MGATSGKKRCRVNNSLITLKLVVFFIFSGIACLHCFNSFYYLDLGLNFEEYRLISILTPLISTIGPLIAGPLADRLAARNANTFGRSLRVLTAICLILASIFYACILSIPSSERHEARKPLVSFGCDSSGAVIFQERCMEAKTCHHWTKFGYLELTNCSYTCQKPSQYEFLYTPWTKGSPLPPTDISSDSDWERDYDETASQATTESLSRYKREPEESLEVFSSETREKREVERVYVNPPHLCIKETDEYGNERVKKCHVYTDDTDSLKVQVTLRSATNKENDTHSADWCNYPLDGFQCDIPEKQVQFMTALKNHSRCKPMMECEVINPYGLDSVLADSVCITTIGDPDASFWGYFVLRFIGEIFPMAALTLLNTAIVIATRETSTGRGEVCRQYVWGSIAWIWIVISFNLLEGDPENREYYYVAMILVAVISFVIAAIILLCASNMPLSPPEWWWHTKTGMLVYPMSAIRKYAPETFALTLITLILGIFFGSIHSYLHLVHRDYYGITALYLLLVLLMFFNVDKFIEYCGHSNILISTFTYYIVRFTAIAIIDEAEWLTITMEALEPLVIGVSWITIILYMRHIIPRRLTATGQALAVIAHFCIGKSLGALIGLVINAKKPEEPNCMYQGLAIAACVIALIYFVLYNLVLGPRCAAKAQPPPPLTSLSQPPQNGSATNGANGSYTPLRVYHNERGKKGQFRY